MPIATRCPKCKAKLKGPDNLIGHTLKCPGCGTPVAITAEFLVPVSAAGTPASQPPKQPSAGVKPAAAPPAPTKAPAKATTNPTKSTMYDDLEIIYDDLEVIDETAQAPPAKTAEAPRVAPVESAKSKPPPAPRPPEKKPPVPPKPQPQPQAKKAPPKEEPKPEQRPAKPVSQPAPPPAAPKIGAAHDIGLIPNLELGDDQPVFPKSQPAAAKEPPPAPLPNLELDKAGDIPMHKDEKPLFPNMELDSADVPRLRDDFDDIKLQGDDDEDIPLIEVKDEEEVFDEYEVFEEGQEEVAEVVEKEVPVLSLAGDDDVVDVAPADDEDDVEDVVEVEAAEDDVDELEEVEETAAADSAFSFNLLKPSVIFVQGQSGMFSINNAYDLLNGRSKKHLGEALEKKDDAAAVMRLFVGNNLVPTRIEVLEGRHRDLVLTIRRPPHLWTSKAEIFDNDNRLLGSFEIQPFSMLMAKPVWISDHREKKIAKMQAQWMKGKCVYSTPDGKKLAETMSQAVYEQRIVLKWAPRGGSFYITFTKLAETKPRHKLLLLGVVLGVDLFFSQNRRGPIIGGGRRF